MKRLLLIPAALFWTELWTSSGLIMTSVLSQLIPSQTFKTESPIFSNFRNSDLRLQQWGMTQLLRPVREHMLSKYIYLIKKKPLWSSMKTREIILLSLGISSLLSNSIYQLMIMWIMCMTTNWRNRTINIYCHLLPIHCTFFRANIIILKYTYIPFAIVFFFPFKCLDNIFLLPLKAKTEFWSQQHLW